MSALRAPPRRPVWARLGGLVVGYTGGALLVLQAEALPSAAAFLPPLVLALLLPRWRGPLLAGVLGAALVVQAAAPVLASRWPMSRHGEVRIVEGRIASLPQGRIEAGTDGGADADPVRPSARTWRFRFEPTAAEQSAGLPAALRASWYRSAETLRGGDCWRLRLTLRTPHGSRNPGGFDYEGWLFRQRIGAVATVRDGERCPTAAEPTPDAERSILRLRQALADRIARWLPQHPAQPLVAALTLGDTSGFDDDDWEALRLTGTTHLVAISGFNVAIVAGAVFWLLRRLWSQLPPLCRRLPAPTAGSAAAVLAALLYALLAGFEPPVQRAALMLALLALAALVGGLGAPWRALALAWVLVIALDPLTLLAPGLWLSFAAVAAIFWVAAGRLGPVPGWQTALAVQLGLSLLLAPLTLYGFQGASLGGPLINLVAVPIVALLTPALLVALLLAALLPALGLPLLTALADALALAHGGLQTLAAQWPQLWAAASPPLPALLLALLGALLLSAPRGVGWPLRLFGALAFAALLIPAPREIAPGRVRLAVLDVGQGLAVVIQTATRTLVYDAGPAWPGGFDAGRSVLLPYLLQSGSGRVDRLIVSHGDLDHRGGVPALLAALPVRAAVGAGQPSPCVAGERWDWDGVRFDLLAGPEAGSSATDNDASCVLRVVAADGTAALLPGDLEAGGEARLVASGRPLQAAVLVTPHHGSKTSSSEVFLDAVQPRLAIHSAGWRHRYGHPAAPVVQRLAGRGVDQLSTGDSGAVIVELGSGLPLPEPIQTRRALARLWTTPAEERWRQQR